MKFRLVTYFLIVIFAMPLYAGAFSVSERLHELSYESSSALAGAGRSVSNWNAQAAAAGASFSDSVGEFLYAAWLRLKSFFAFGQGDSLLVEVFEPASEPSPPVAEEPAQFPPQRSFDELSRESSQETRLPVGQGSSTFTTDVIFVPESPQLPTTNYQLLTTVDAEARGILSRLVSIIADGIVPNLGGETTIIRSGGSRSSFSEIAGERFVHVAGDTMTGALGGTDAAFSGAVSAAALNSTTLSVTGSTTFNGVEYGWPSADGAANEILKTNGAGGLDWTPVSAILPGADWVFFSGSGLRLATTTNQVLIGASATSSAADLEVQGDAYVSGTLGVGTTTPFAKLSVAGDGWFDGTLTVSRLAATSTALFGSATSTNMHVAGSLTGTGTDLTLARLGASTFSTVQHLMNAALSAGLWSGGEVTDAGGGSVDVAAGSGFIRAADSNTAPLMFFDWPAATISIPVDEHRVIGVSYGGGAPAVVSRTTDVWDYDTEFPLAFVVNEGGDVHIVNEPWQTGDTLTNIIERFDAMAGLRRDERVGGLILSETGTRNVAVTGGQFVVRLSEFEVDAIDTSAADTFDAYYRDGGSSFTKQAAQTQYDNTSYDDGSGTLAAMTDNYYASRWFYLETDGDLIMLYGQAEYETLAEALEDSSPAALPDRVMDTGILIGRFVIQKSAAPAERVQTVFTTSFFANSVTEHGQLAGLDQDEHTQYALLAGRSGGQALVGGNAATDDLVLQSTSGSGAAGADIIFRGGVAGASEFMRILNDGNVGIGTTSPYAKLSVVGPVVAEYFTATSTSATSTFPRLSATQSALGTVVSGVWNAGALTSSGVLTVNGVGDSYIAGNLGLGTTSPWGKLSVTNTGSNPSFVVEDSASPDTTPFIIDASGNVGIGGAATSRKLSITNGAGNESANSQLLYLKQPNDFGFSFNIDDASTGDLYLKPVNNGTEGRPIFTFSRAANGGNAVAIGRTDSPSYMLDVKSISGQQLRLDADSGAQFTTLRMANNGTDKALIAYDNTNATFEVGAAASADLLLKTNSTEKVRVTSGGNVGIGTTSPWGKLSVTNTGADPSFVVEDAASPDTTPFIITASGGVGIGRTTVEATLDVAGPVLITNNQGLYMEDAAAANRIVLNTDSSDNVILQNGTNGDGGPIVFNSKIAAGESARFDASGRFGIATTSPWRTLSVTGTVGLSSSLTSGTTGNYLCINTSTFEVTSGTTCSASSARFKENINTLSYGLDEVLELRPVSFRYKPEFNPDASTRIGFIAEEVEEIIPEVVSHDKDGRPEAVSYDNLVALLVRGMQELSAKVSAGATAAGDSLAAAVGRFANLFAARFTVGSSEAPVGITLFDEITGDPYCLSIRNGESVTRRGECGIGVPDLDGGGVDESEDSGAPEPSESGSSDEESGQATSTPDTIEEPPLAEATEGEENLSDNLPDESSPESSPSSGEQQSIEH